MLLTSMRAPKTSPVTPPRRRVAARRSRSAASNPASTAAAPRTDPGQPQASPAAATDASRAAPAAILAGEGRRARNQCAEPVRARRRGAGPGGEHHGGPSGDHRRRDGGRAGPAGRNGGERGDLHQQHDDQRDHAERPDVGPAHDRQGLIPGPAAAQPVRGVGEPVEVQPPGEQGEHPDRQRRRQQQAGRGPAASLHRQQHTGRRNREQHAHNRQPEHRPGRLVSADLRGGPHRDDREQAEGGPRRDQAGQAGVGGRGGAWVTAAAARSPPCRARPRRWLRRPGS